MSSTYMVYTEHSPYAGDPPDMISDDLAEALAAFLKAVWDRESAALVWSA